MSLYHEAYALLTTPNTFSGSFKARIYNRKGGKASPAQLYALVTQTSKWSPILKEVIDHAEILSLEPKLNPIMSLLLVHDLLLSKTGIAAAEKHALRAAIERHKTRLKAEFNKVRLRHRCATIEELRATIEDGKLTSDHEQVLVRWVRINTAVTSLEEQLETTFKEYTLASLRDVQTASPMTRVVHRDEHVPDLIAMPPGAELTTTRAYKNGEIILQDKASCFPAYLLLGSTNRWHESGDIVDACAAPGNKTTHLAGLISKASWAGRPTRNRIFAVERDLKRSKTLQDMVKKTQTSDIISILPGQDFLALKPTDPRLAAVTAILLDPSCSGSGIVGREDVPQFVLPETPRQSSKVAPASKKRKRHLAALEPLPMDSPSPAAPSQEEPDASRLESLSNLQTHLLEHAFSFPAVTSVTYSTCSIYHVENEGVIIRALGSPVARERGWRVLHRSEQVRGLSAWPFRGIEVGGTSASRDRRPELQDEEREGCLRCWPPGHQRSGAEGTMGFFAVGFVRGERIGSDASSRDNTDDAGLADCNGRGEIHPCSSLIEEKEWEGFED